jgi:LAGLIDADG endonuclease
VKNQSLLGFLRINPEIIPNRLVGNLTVGNIDFHTNVLIPFFDSLTWHSKKELDYVDWKTVLRIREEGKHFTPEGENIVKLLGEEGREKPPLELFSSLEL